MSDNFRFKAVELFFALNFLVSLVEFVSLVKNLSLLLADPWRDVFNVFCKEDLDSDDEMLHDDEKDKVVQDVFVIQYHFFASRWTKVAFLREKGIAEGHWEH